MFPVVFVFCLKLTSKLSKNAQGLLPTSQLASRQIATKVQPLTQLNEDELMMKESVAKLASQIIAPFVKKMDIQQSFEPDVVNALFANGVIYTVVFIYFG
jgi:hypothetical protein